jgi:hypothetical protein
MTTDEEFNASCEHLANLLREAEAARAREKDTRAVLAHCVVELAMRGTFPTGPMREARRAKLFALWEAGGLRVSIGDSRTVVEFVADAKPSLP